MGRTYASGFKPLPEHLIEIAYHSAWSIQNMAAHGKENESASYVGSTEKANGDITDYFQDQAGGWWFDNRFRKPTGEIISMEEKIFGRRLPERRKGKWQK